MATEKGHLGVDRFKWWEGWNEGWEKVRKDDQANLNTFERVTVKQYLVTQLKFLLCFK